MKASRAILLLFLTAILSVAQSPTTGQSTWDRDSIIRAYELEAEAAAEIEQKERALREERILAKEMELLARRKSQMYIILAIPITLIVIALVVVLIVIRTRRRRFDAQMPPPPPKQTQPPRWNG